MNNAFVKTICLIFILACALSADSAIAQQEDPPEILDLRVGFDNRYKVGNWVPVKITFRGGSKTLIGTVTLTVPDGDGIPSQVIARGNHQVVPGQETSVSVFARFGRVDSTATVRFIVDGEVVAKREFESHYNTAGNGYYLEGMNATQPLYLVVGTGGVGLQKAVTLANRKHEEIEPVVVRIGDLKNLPTRWYGYEGVDAIVLSTSRPEIYSKLRGTDDPRLTALDQWIRMGGKLVLAVGANGEDVLGAGMPLTCFAPGKLYKMSDNRHSRGWESYTGGPTPFPKMTGKDKAGMSVPRLENIRDREIEAREADLPLVIRSPRGFGQIVFVAADLDREPFSKWRDRGRLMARVLGLPISTDEKSDTDTAMMHHGYEDISGQLRSALDHFTGVRLVPFGVVIVLVLIYIILIGPVDYFFLKKFVGRMQWTWVTFPLIVVAFSVGAYYLAYYLKGDQLRVNQVDLIDVDTTAGSGFVRGTSWANIFSPRMEAYNLTFQPKGPDGNPDEDARGLTAWLGLTGSGLGGMNQPGGGGSVWQHGYSFSPDLDTMRGVPIQVWSTKSIMGRWHATCKDFPQARLSLDDDMLDGRITNTLGFPLHKCLLAYGRWVYEFETIEAGQTVRVKDAKTTKALKTLLTGRRAVQSDDEKQVRQQATPYDVSSTDVDYVMREMMFFKASGGKGYSQLTNNYQPFVDFSEIIKLNRAVLVGYGPQSSGTQSGENQPAQGGAVLLNNGQPLAPEQNQHKTVYRFVFEVKVDDKNTKSN